MIPPFFFRSMIFNGLFYLLTAASCIVLLPTLLLPRHFFLSVVKGFVCTTAFLEKYILGLTYEIRGKEHLPQQGSYLVAAKHQSAYETTKLHILFNDPAIVLKKELLKIPLWGLYLAKSDVIAIDRSTPKNAVQSIQDGAKRMAAQRRPIVIFPQGTRVSTQTTTAEKPYKIGIVRMQESTQLPIIPMALNTGVFWPRNSLFKKPGRVIFEFLPPILPGGEPSEVLAKLQKDVEEKSIALMDEGRKSIPKRDRTTFFTIVGLIVFMTAWTINWFIASSITRDAVHNFITQLQYTPEYQGSVISDPALSGFPFKIKLSFGLQKLAHQGQVIEISGFEAKSWPFLGFPITVVTGPISILVDSWSAPVTYEELRGKFSFNRDTLDITYSRLKKGDFESLISGTVVFKPPYPALDLLLNIKNHESLLADLLKSKAVRSKEAMIAEVTLASLKKKDGITLKLTSAERNVYLGPLRVYQFPDVEIEPAVLEDGSESDFAIKRQKPTSP